MKGSLLTITLLATASLAACASSQAVRTSADTMIIQTSAAPACGANGAAKVAQAMAAIETIRAGYDAYIILDAASANNVQVSQGPGTVYTSGTVTYCGNYGTYNGTSTYQPGPTIISGSHDQSFAIQMFKAGQPGAERAIPARDVLGPDWATLVKEGVNSCL